MVTSWHSMEQVVIDNCRSSSLHYVYSGYIQVLVFMKQIWRLWAKSLGEKAGATDKEADRVALIRTCILLFYIITNAFIIAGVIRHWNN